MSASPVRPKVEDDATEGRFDAPPRARRGLKHQIRGTTVLVVLALLVPLFANVAPAQQAPPQGTTEEKLAELRRRLSQASSHETDLLALIRESDVRVSELNKITADLSVKLNDARRRLGSAQTDLDETTAKYLAKSGEVDQAEQLYTEIRVRLSDRVVRLYKDGNLGEIDLFLNATSFSQIDSGRSYLNKVAADDRESADRLGELRDVLESEKFLLESTRGQLLESRNTVDVETSELTRIYQENESARQLAQAETDNHRQLLAKVLADKNQSQRLLDELEGASNRAASDLGIEGSRGNPSIVPGYFIWPADGPLTSKYGYRVHPISGARKLHAGVDIGAGSGTPIKAAASGKVLRAGPYGGYGLATIVDHGNGLATLYAHQSRFVVSAGDQVSQGDIIGYVGSTGYSTGPHLHFETRINGQPHDPLAWFPDR